VWCIFLGFFPPDLHRFPIKRGCRYKVTHSGCREEFDYYYGFAVDVCVCDSDFCNHGCRLMAYSWLSLVIVIAVLLLWVFGLYNVAIWLVTGVSALSDAVFGVVLTLSRPITLLLYGRWCFYSEWYCFRNIVTLSTCVSARLLTICINQCVVILLLV